MRNFFIAFLLLVTTFSVKADPMMDAAFDKESIKAENELRSGQIGELEFARKIAQLARDFFPSDKDFIELRDFKVDLARRLEREEITREYFDSVWAVRRDEFNRVRAAQKENERIVNEQQEQVDNSQVLSDTLRGIANSMKRAYPPTSTTNCITQNLGGIITTTCR